MSTAYPSKRTQGLFFFCLHLVVSCLNDVLFKLLGQQLPSAHVTFLRFFFASLTLFAFALIAQKSLKTKFLHIHALRGLILFAGMTLWCFGLTHTPLADAIVINFTIPLFLLVMCALFLKEKVEKKRWLATLISFLGILIVTKPVSETFNPYSVLMIATAAIFACSDILNKIYATCESMFCSLFYTAFFTTIFSAIFIAINSLFAHESLIFSVSASQLFYTFLLGIGANLTLYLILRSFELIDAKETASMRYLELILSALAGYIFFGEIPASSTLVGAIFIIPTTIYIVLQDSSCELESGSTNCNNIKSIQKPTLATSS